MFKNKKNFFKLHLFVYFFFYNSFGLTDDSKKICKSLINVIEINTEAYKSCLLSKAGEKYSSKELNNCKKYYLTEIERLSYVFKNLCSKKN